MRREIETLRERWHAACADLGSPSARDEIFDELVGAYTGPTRHYHNLRHIAECLDELDSNKHLARDRRAIELAIWFHDIVFDVHRPDNEARSADLAVARLARLAAPPQLRDEVHRLILLTRHDTAPADIDGQLIVDIDLASLAKPPAEFDENSRNIRREFAHIPDCEFNRRQKSLLARFLARPSIYFTKEFADRLEQRARNNLERSVR